MRRWRMLLLKERSLRTSRRTSFLSILVTNHGHPTSVCLWTNRVEVPQGYCNKKDVRTTQPRAVANRVNLMDEFYSGERKLWTDRFFRYHLLSSPRHRVVLSSISRPNRQQQLQVGRVFPSQVSYCRRVQNNPRDLSPSPRLRPHGGCSFVPDPILHMTTVATKRHKRDILVATSYTRTRQVVRENGNLARRVAASMQLAP
ncbi:hypothetical protein F5141DRAFT_500411 [Pisolithus sp. B1]|nr:hypothetical protein F5141DRAFT_500411 [Pisolithus sp. B1]